MGSKCHNCGSADLKSLYAASAFDSSFQQSSDTIVLARCESCHLVCTTGVNDDAIGETYTREYYGSGTSKFLSIIESVLELFKKRQARKITRTWQRCANTGRSPSVLDIGCGRGPLLRAFQSFGASVLGLERREFPTDELSGNIVRVGSIADPEYADTHFDIVILWHVFEHLEKQAELLDTITEHLNENGLLVIAVPNFSSLQQRIFTRYWFHLDLPRHLVHLESHWLQQQLLDRGFTIEDVSYIDLLQNTYGFIQSSLNTIAPHRMNDFYRLLKHGLSLEPRTALPLLKWGILASLIFPFALLENIVSGLTRKGATVQIAARRGNRP